MADVAHERLLWFLRTCVRGFDGRELANPEATLKELIADGRAKLYAECAMDWTGTAQAAVVGQRTTVVREGGNQDDRRDVVRLPQGARTPGSRARGLPSGSSRA